jgi:hypothetical protein
MSPAFLAIFTKAFFAFSSEEAAQNMICLW